MKRYRRKRMARTPLAWCAAAICWTYFCNEVVIIGCAAFHVRLEVRWEWQTERGAIPSTRSTDGTRHDSRCRPGSVETVFGRSVIVMPDEDVRAALQRRIARYGPVTPGMASMLGIGMADSRYRRARIGHDAAFADFTRIVLAQVADPACGPRARKTPYSKIQG